MVGGRLRTTGTEPPGRGASNGRQRGKGQESQVSAVCMCISTQSTPRGRWRRADTGGSSKRLPPFLRAGAGGVSCRLRTGRSPAKPGLGQVGARLSPWQTAPEEQGDRCDGPRGFSHPRVQAPRSCSTPSARAIREEADRPRSEEHPALLTPFARIPAAASGTRESEVFGLRRCLTASPGVPA